MTITTATGARLADTGVEERRRPLTDEELADGAIPAPFTPREWKAMARTSQEMHATHVATAVVDALDGGPRAIVRSWSVLGRLANALGGRLAR